MDKLLPGKGFFEVKAAAAGLWGGPTETFLRAELGVKPNEHVDLFAFGQAERTGWQAGAGARVTW